MAEKKRYAGEVEEMGDLNISGGRP
ncbi:hypothetical protein VTP01DRAFT_5779 [Rhizomucor pusillus]